MSWPDKSPFWSRWTCEPAGRSSQRTPSVPIPQDHLASSRHRRLLSPEENSTNRLPRDFDGARYLVLHPDVAEAGVDPAHHYLTHGRFEGRAYK